MKDLLSKFIYLFYKYYNKGSTKEIAYESALFVLSFIIFLNLFALIIISNLGKHISFDYDDARGLKYLIFGIIYLIPSYFILKRVFKKEEIIKMGMSKSDIRKGYILSIGYIILSIAVIIIVVKTT